MQQVLRSGVCRFPNSTAAGSTFWSLPQSITYHFALLRTLYLRAFARALGLALAGARFRAVFARGLEKMLSGR